jgi:hypothetical protein
MRDTIATKLKEHKPNISRHKKEKILNAENYRISSLFEFLQGSQYNIYLNGKKCNSVGDIRKIIALHQFNTYEFSKTHHLTQYYNFVETSDINIEIITLEKWLEFFGIESSLEKS